MAYRALVQIDKASYLQRQIVRYQILPYLGLSPGEVRTRHEACLRQLRQIMTEHGADNSFEILTESGQKSEIFTTVKFQHDYFQNVRRQKYTPKLLKKILLSQELKPIDRYWASQWNEYFVKLIKTPFLRETRSLGYDPVQCRQYIIHWNERLAWTSHNSVARYYLVQNMIDALVEATEPGRGKCETFKSDSEDQIARMDQSCDRLCDPRSDGS